MQLQLYELKDDFRNTGYDIVDEVKNNGSDICESRMDELFEPLLEIVATKHNDALQQCIDEERGKVQDLKDLQEKDEIFENLRAELSESVYVTVNREYVDCTACKWFIPKRDVYTESGRIRVVCYPPEKDYNDLGYDELIDMDISDKYDFMERVEITTDTEALGDAITCNITRVVEPYPSLEHLLLIKQSGADLCVTLDTLCTLLLAGYKKSNPSHSRAHLRTCQTVIKRGSRKGMICHRDILRNNMCRYHNHKRPKNSLF